MDVLIYTDGACSGNPGPGGYGAVLVYGSHRRELSGGYRHTTNGRMEIMAVIKGLEALTRPCNVTIMSDSEYIVNTINIWLRRWVVNGFKGKKNVDLWNRYIDVSKPHKIQARWIKGHGDNVLNNRADELASNFSQEVPEEDL